METLYRTDIVLMTHNRLLLLEKTLEYLWERTKSPYRLHVIDDGSIGGNTAYLQSIFNEGGLDSLTLHKVPWGIPANLTALSSLAISDSVYLTGDDTLVPEVEPDWLSRGLASLERHPDIGILGLNNPSCNLRKSRKRKEVRDEITLCTFIGGGCFIRREILKTLPEEVVLGAQSPVKTICSYVRKYTDFKVAYLTETYCQHTGKVSVRRGEDISGYLLEPVDRKTLKPPEEYDY